jgi:putative membrane protein
MKKVFLASAFVAALAIQACNSGSKTNSTTDASTNDSSMMDTASNTSTMATDTSAMNPASTNANTFMEQAAVGGMMEVEAGKVAQSQSTNAAVKDFAATMIKDHTKANDELKGIASKKSFTLPASLPAAEKNHLDEMKKLSGADFDKHYIGMMVTDHAKTVALFTAGGKNPDQEISGFAGKTLPIIQAHYKKATDLQTAVNK